MTRAEKADGHEELFCYGREVYPAGVTNGDAGAAADGFQCVALDGR